MLLRDESDEDEERALNLRGASNSPPKMWITIIALTSVGVYQGLQDLYI